jgi:hypothetical protein
MDSAIVLAELIVKIGLLFAKCDGVFDSKEDLFIDSFSKKLVEGQITNKDIEMHFQEIKKKDYSFEEIIEETKSFLSIFNDVEKKKVIDAITGFIKELIAADSVYAPEEIDLYNQWIKEFHSEEE